LKPDSDTCTCAAAARGRRRLRHRSAGNVPVLAPPVLKVGDLVLSQYVWTSWTGTRYDMPAGCPTSFFTSDLVWAWPPTTSSAAFASTSSPS
jgi:hypothetical protein